MVTKEYLAKSRLETVPWAIALMVPILAAALGALAILFSNTAKIAFQFHSAHHPKLNAPAAEMQVRSLHSG